MVSDGLRNSVNPNEEAEYGATRIRLWRNPPATRLQSETQRQYALAGGRSASAEKWRINTRARFCAYGDVTMIGFKTTKPHALLAAIKRAIDDKKITTWMYQNGYFTHTPDQWRAKAWLLPSVVEGSELRFGIIHPQNGAVGSEVYAVYHGRFIEMALAHFDTEFDNSVATAMPTSADKLKAA